MLLALNFSLPAFSGAGPGDFEIPPASVDGEELRDIRDRLSTSLFFKGELADSIIEAGLQDRLLKLSGRETYSEVRLGLIGWIKSDLDEAANLYFYLKDRRPEEAKPPESISYKLPTYEINPHFLELIEGVGRAAKDSSISDEEVSLAEQRLFEGPQARPEAYAPWAPPAAGEARASPSGTPAKARAMAAAARGAGGSAAINYADYSLNPARVELESRALGEWFESVKASMEAESRDPENGKDLAAQRGFFDETFFAYRNFVVALSGLKGRKKITGEEAARLEELRRSLRKNLGELETLSVMRRINRRAQTLPPLSPGARVLIADARRIEGALRAFLADLRGDPESVKTAAARLYELEKAFDFWLLRSSAHKRLSDLKGRMTGRRFSCVLDKLLFAYLARFSPSAAYVRLEAGRAGSAAALDASLEGVAAGNYEAAAAFSGEKRSLPERIRDAESGAAGLESYSRFNRRLQFFFWDVFVNPFGLAPGPWGISAANKLLF